MSGRSKKSPAKQGIISKEDAKTAVLQVEQEKTMAAMDTEKEPEKKSDIKKIVEALAAGTLLQDGKTDTDLLQKAFSLVLDTEFFRSKDIKLSKLDEEDLKLMTENHINQLREMYIGLMERCGNAEKACYEHVYDSACTFRRKIDRYVHVCVVTGMEAMPDKSFEKAACMWKKLRTDVLPR